jgi:hypothetical protein
MMFVVLYLPDYPEYDGGSVLVHGRAGLLHDGHGVGGDGGQPYKPHVPNISVNIDSGQ